MANWQERYVTGDDTTSNWNSLDYMGQSFTIGNTGNNLTFNITDIEVKIGKTGTPASSLKFEIYNSNPAGEPTGTALSTGTIEETDVSSTNSWKKITMSDATLQANKKYVLLGTFTNDASNYYNWRHDSTSPTYTGGNRMTSSDFISWTQATGDDFMFSINGGDYAGTLCSLADAVNKAGANASSAGTSEVLVSDFVKQAEGVINAITRYDWVAKYSSLTNQVKYILNQVASDMAAIYIITYDMSGFTDRVEAETMINVYRESVARGLSLLRNQEVKSFMVDDT